MNQVSSSDSDSDSDSDAQPRPANAVFSLPSGEPIPMFLHKSLGKGGRSAIRKKITDAGGKITDDEEHAEVILCRDDLPAFKALERKYDHFRYVWVEAPSWVDYCIGRRRYKHVLPGRTNGVNRAGRIGYTTEDDKHLCKFLALRLPFKETGGRIGNGVYKDLVHPDNAYLYPWAKRHSWMSWRGRYTTNQEQFDRAIELRVNKEADPPKPGGKGQYVIPRRKKKDVPVESIILSDEDEEQTDDEGEIEEDVVPEPPSRKRPPEYGPSQRRVGGGPLKKRRRGSEGEGDNHIAHRTDKGKERQHQEYNPNSRAPQDSDFGEGLQSNEVAPGPSHFNGAHRDDQRVASAQIRPRPHLFDADNPNTPNRLPLASQYPQNGRTSDRPSNTQKTVANKSHHRSAEQLPDTQATLVQSSQPRVRSSQPHVRSSRPSRSENSGQAPYPNTRSHPRPISEYPIITPPAFPPIKRARGRPRKNPLPGTPPQPSPVREPSPHVASSRAAGAASALDEARVEAILEEGVAVQRRASEDSEEDSDEDSDDSSSSDDQKAERDLIAGQKSMVGLPGQARAPENNRHRQPRALDPPHIDLTARTRVASPSRKATLLRPTSHTTTPKHALEPDPNTTLKARPALVDSKNTKDQDSPSLSAQSDMEESDVGTETTTSFPAEPTDAFEYKTAGTPFTPAPGTRAEQYQRTKAKGKGRAV